MLAIIFIVVIILILTIIFSLENIPDSGNKSRTAGKKPKTVRFADSLSQTRVLVERAERAEKMAQASAALAATRIQRIAAESRKKEEATPPQGRSGSASGAPPRGSATGAAAASGVPSTPERGATEQSGRKLESILEETANKLKKKIGASQSRTPARRGATAQPERGTPARRGEAPPPAATGRRTPEAGTHRKSGSATHSGLPGRGSVAAAPAPPGAAAPAGKGATAATHNSGSPRRGSVAAAPATAAKQPVASPSGSATAATGRETPGA